MTYYIQIDRQDRDSSDPLEPVVIGPFEKKSAASSHMEDSMDVEDWCYGEAKAKGYIVDDVYLTKKPEIPSYGINAPLITDEDFDASGWVRIGRNNKN